MSREPEPDVQLTPADRALLRAVGRALEPPPMSAARQAAFGRAVAERIAPSSRGWLQWTPPLIASAAAAAALFAALPVSETTPLPAEELVALVYASDAVAGSGELSSPLPGEYQLLADVLEVQEDEP